MKPSLHSSRHSRDLDLDPDHPTHTELLRLHQANDLRTFQHPYASSPVRHAMPVIKYPEPSPEFLLKAKSNRLHAEIMRQAGHLEFAKVIDEATDKAEEVLSNSMERFRFLQSTVIFSRSKVNRLQKIMAEGRAGEGVFKEFDKHTKTLASKEPEMYDLEVRIPGIWIQDSNVLMNKFLRENRRLF